MKKITLTTDEKLLLGEYFESSQIKLIRLKAQAMLMRHKGLKNSDIGDLLFRKPRTVIRWINDFYERRMASIFSGHVDNQNSSKLTIKQKEEIAETLKNPPSAYGLPKEFWDVPNLKKYVKAEFGVVYESPQSYHFLLRFSDFSFKQPEKFDVHRDEKQIEKRIKEVRNEIAEYLKNPKWEIFASDETRIMIEALTRKAWIKKGEKTIIKVKRDNEYQSYIGLLNLRNGKCHLYELDWQEQDEIIRSIKKFLKKYSSKRICIVWDNARFHKGKKIREELRKGGFLERVHLINFPPYAPDKNPVEHVWKEAKAKIANMQFSRFKETKDAFRRAVSSQKFNFKI